MSWLWAIVVGFVLGLIAKAILPGKQHSPLWLTTIFGIIGAIIGNSLASGFGIDDTKGIDWGRHALQLVAALVVVGVGDMAYKMIKGNKQQA
ncbi:GlsB/YeaQ/YmgE family stress response membrane protein [Streptomyces durmitorensis]|uniref:GlsB/YeaQ/YmgE family stress response membrane protein n=1 Tax=Streptomyces durmitorensis TaxID=319947 RepID=A0ABY4Q2K5_9ACTN|nr:GlsB/YeaQ/YmgE family stress response membrane protein [Streptomyces durmitorensis]UQT59394.1 GlsB/YeaQ/YmgE family stress response membrane protein [Streptomyces durmitorensis]